MSMPIRLILLLTFLLAIISILGGCGGERPQRGPIDQLESQAPDSTPLPMRKELFEWLADEVIEAVAKSSSISHVSLEIRNLTANEIYVVVPAGTYFGSGSDSVQNMVTRHSAEVELGANEVDQISIDAACANMHRSIPGEGHSLTIQKSTDLPLLELLVEVLDAESSSYSTEQAAIWMITDDAGFAGLGTLSSSFGGISGSRLIGEEDAARAMQILDRVGINLTVMNIWRDRDKIIDGLEDQELRDWLEQYDEVEFADSSDLGLTLAHGDHITHMDFSPDGQRMATIASVEENEFSGQHELLVWDLAKPGVNQLIESFDQDLMPADVAWIDEGTLLTTIACSSLDYTECREFELNTWNIDTGQQVTSVSETVFYWPWEFSFSSGGRWLSTPHCLSEGFLRNCTEFEVRVWDTASGRLVHVVDGLTSFPHDTDFSPDESVLVLVDGAQLVLFDLENLERSSVSTQVLGPIIDLRWVSDDALVLMTCQATERGCNGMDVMLLDLQSGQTKSLFELSGVSGEVAVSPNGRQLVTTSCLGRTLLLACVLGEATFWDLDERQIVDKVKIDGSQPTFSPDGESVAIVDSSGQAVILDIGATLEGRVAGD